MPATKPYLDAIDNSPETVPLLLEWGRALGESFGTSGAVNALQYYERIGWISEPVRKRMITYLQGMSLEELNNKTYDEPASLRPPIGELNGTPFAVHARSLRYVATIAGDDLDEGLVLGRLAEHRSAATLGPGFDAHDPAMGG